MDRHARRARRARAAIGVGGRQGAGGLGRRCACGRSGGPRICGQDPTSVDSARGRPEPSEGRRRGSASVAPAAPASEMMTQLSLAVVLTAFSFTSLGGAGAENGEWRHYSGDNAATKYSPLDQINKDNVARLRDRLAAAAGERRVRRCESAAAADQQLSIHAALSSTACSMRPTASVSPRRSTRKRQDTCGRRRASRARGAGGASRRRVLGRKGGARHHLSRPILYALNPKTGEPITSFGTGGRVDLTAASARSRPLQLERRSARRPRRHRHGVVDGRSGLGHRKMEGDAGDVRAYDVRTGKLRWTFRVIPRPGEPGIRDVGERLVELHAAPATSGR